MFKYRLKRCKFVSTTDERSEGFDHRREQNPRNKTKKQNYRKRQTKKYENRKKNKTKKTKTRKNIE